MVATSIAEKGSDDIANISHIDGFVDLQEDQSKLKEREISLYIADIKIIRDIIGMKILQSISSDIDEIFRLYEVATGLQKIKFPENQWPKFDRSLVETEIKEQRQWKIVINNQIACVWAITFQDPEIWEARDRDPSIYIHRIATNPNFRGRNLVLEIVTWAKVYAPTHNKSYIRMDTCGDNKKLIAHYASCGFDFLGMSKLENTTGLPSHYVDADVCLFEINLNKK